MYRLSKIGLIVFMLLGGFVFPLLGGQIDVLEDLHTQTDGDKYPSSQQNVNIAPIIMYLLSDSGTTPPPPEKPYGVQAVPVNMTSDKVNITWNDGSNNENGFHIYRSSTVDGTKTRIKSVGANVTSFQNSGLSACGSYYYWVKAYNSGGLSDFSDYANATTAPAAPIGLYTTNYVIRSTTLYWDNNNDSGCTVRYHIYAKYPEDSSYSMIPDSNNLTDGTGGYNNVGIQPETYIYYRVVAENSDGVYGSMSCEVESGYRNALAESGNTSCKTAVGYAFNDKPLYPWASKDKTKEVVFSWDDVPIQYNNNGTSVDMYANCFKIDYKIGSGEWNASTDCSQNPVQSNGWQYQLFTIYGEGVPDNTDISLRISTHYLYNGVDAYSDPIIITGKTLPAGSSGGGTTPLGSAPWIVTSNYYPGKIMVGWGTSDAATRYDIYRGVWNGTSCSTSSLSAYKSFSSGSNFDDLVGDWKKYCYKVRACNDDDCTEFSYAEYGSSGGGI